VGPPLIVRPQALCIFVLNQYKSPLIARPPVISDHIIDDFGVVLNERDYCTTRQNTAGILQFSPHFLQHCNTIVFHLTNEVEIFYFISFEKQFSLYKMQKWANLKYNLLAIIEHQYNTVVFPSCLVLTKITIYICLLHK